VFEQLVAICTGIFHGGRGDIGWGGLILPIGVAIGLLVLLLLNYPRPWPEELPVEAGGETEASGRETPPDKK
jgi:hypothetical protein